MYIKTTSTKWFYQWLLFSHTGKVMARSNLYDRKRDAMRVGRQIAKKLNIPFAGHL